MVILYHCLLIQSQVYRGEGMFDIYQQIVNTPSLQGK